MDQYRLFARVLEAFTNNELPALVNELLALEAEEEGKARIPSMLEEEILDVEVLPTVSALAASSASAAYNTLPSILEEEVPDVQILPTVAPAAPTVTSAVSTALAACFA